MNRLIIPVLSAVALGMFSCSQNTQKVPAALPRDAEIERKVDSLLATLTLEEKIGQMTELVVDRLVKFDQSTGFTIDEAMLDTIIGKYKVGSILNTPGTTALPVDKWHELIGRIQEKSMEEIGIPCIYGLDQNHGTTYSMGGTMFPQNISVAASFNPQLAYDAARITAYETRACACPWTYSPTLDLARDPRWPRFWENYGEDCYLSAKMGEAAVKGFQGDDPNHIDKYSIGVSVKHYMGYGTPFTGKDRTPVFIAPQDIREKHFAPFLAAIRAGALNIMVNSGTINGVPCHMNHELLTGWLKEDLNWDGMIITDWADINNLWRREKVAANKKEAIKLAINAGIDMAMEPYEWDFCILLKELVNEGEVSMQRIDDATRRVLRMKYRLGLFDQPMTNKADYPLFGSAEHAKVATKAAEESIVLLKNDNNLLPLARGKKILVTGPNANTMRGLNGGWTYTWQGHMTNKFAADYNTILEALENKFGKENVVYEPGVLYNETGAYWEEHEPQIDKAVAAAKRADVIVACIGENSYCETPGNLTDLTLSRNQLNLVHALAKTGKRILLVLNEGRPRLIGEIEPLAEAVVNVLLPGNYGGDALANLLAGDANFSAKLPFTYPKEINSLVTYDYKMSEDVATMEGAYNYNAVVSAQWPFGYGLSYTTFEYGKLSVNKTEFTPDDELEFSIDVKNTGNVVGKEVVMLYSRDLVAAITPDNRRLRAFEKVEIEPGQTKTVTLRLKASDLAFVGADEKWVLEAGDFRVWVANSDVTISCTQTKKWDTPNIN